MTTSERAEELRARARADVANMPPLEGVPVSTRKPPVARCKSCFRPIWWRVNPSGKRQPMDYDLVTATATTEPHHATCPQREAWKKR